MEIVGIGIDLAGIGRIKRIINGKAGKRFVKNTFTNREILCARGNIGKLASDFAAKEAVFKALGTGWIDGKEVELLRDPDTGSPKISVYGDTKEEIEKKEVNEILVSISKTNCCAAAVVILTS